MKDFCVLGSGISGSTIANLLNKEFSVEVFDKARGIGGRASNKRYQKKLSFDHGLQYISPRNREFSRFIHLLFNKKVLKLWKGHHLNFDLFKNKIDNKYIGNKGNNEISKYLLKNVKTNLQSTISKLTYKKNYWQIELLDKKIICFRKLIITCPFPQARNLAKKYLSKKLLNKNIKMLPNITVMFAYKGKNIPISSIKFNDDLISWVSNENSKKRFNSNLNLWTLQASLKWSIKKINKYKNDKKIMNQLISKFIKLTGFDSNKIVYKKIHGWKYSYNYEKTSLLSYWDKKCNLGVCGDWFNGPKVENAWLSANDLSQKIKKNPLKNKRV